MVGIDWLMRAAHVLAGATWVGGSIMYLVVVIPALRLAGPAPKLSAAIATQFKRLTNLCIAVLLLSGGSLVFYPLTQKAPAWAYLVTLGLKTAAAPAVLCQAYSIG